MKKTLFLALAIFFVFALTLNVQAADADSSAQNQGAGTDAGIEPGTGDPQDPTRPSEDLSKDTNGGLTDPNHVENDLDHINDSTGSNPDADNRTNLAEDPDNPIKPCDLSVTCPPENCPCIDRAMVNVIAVHIKKFRPQGIINDNESPWIDLPFNEGVYDLMNIKDDLFTKLGVADADMPVGHYSMIRLLLDGQEIAFCGNDTVYPFYVAQENKNKQEIKKGIKTFETYYVCPGTHTNVQLRFPEDGFLTWVKDTGTVRLHPKIYAESVTCE